MGKRVIVSDEILSQMKAEAYQKKSMEGVKIGSPVDEMTNINDPDSIISKYLTKKKAEYELFIENFDEEYDERMERLHNSMHGIRPEDDEIEETVVGGVGSYGIDEDDIVEENNSNIIQVDFNKENINQNNIIDDLL